VTELGSGRHVFLASAMAWVGLDPRKDVTFAVHSPAESIRLLAEGKIRCLPGVRGGSAGVARAENRPRHP